MEMRETVVKRKHIEAASSIALRKPNLKHSVQSFISTSGVAIVMELFYSSMKEIDSFTILNFPHPHPHLSLSNFTDFFDTPHDFFCLKKQKAEN